VNYLVEKGADINAVGEGNTSPLRVAVEALGIDHELVEYLMSLGAADTGDEEDEEGYDGGVGDLPTAPEMQQELIIAIKDEREEYLLLKKTNDDLQKKIYLKVTSRKKVIIIRIKMLINRFKIKLIMKLMGNMKMIFKLN